MVHSLPVPFYKKRMFSERIEQVRGRPCLRMKPPEACLLAVFLGSCFPQSSQRLPELLSLKSSSAFPALGSVPSPFSQMTPF